MARLICRPVDDIEFVHKVNVIGPLRVSQAMLPLLKKGNKKVVSIHSIAPPAIPHIMPHLRCNALASAWCPGMWPGACAVILAHFLLAVLDGGPAMILRSALLAGWKEITVQMTSLHMLVANILYPAQCAAAFQMPTDAQLVVLDRNGVSLVASMQIANVSSTLGSIGDKAQYIKNDEARKANPFASKIVAYKMAKVRSAEHCRFFLRKQMGVCTEGRPLIHSSMRPALWLVPIDTLVNALWQPVP